MPEPVLTLLHHPVSLDSCGGDIVTEYGGWKRETERDRERERERERDRDGQREREIKKERETEREVKRDREGDRETERETIREGKREIRDLREKGMKPQLSFLFFPFSYIREDCRIFTRIITCFVFCDDCFRAFNVMILNISSLQSHITTSLMPIIHLYFFSLLSCIYCISITLNSFLPSFLPSHLSTLFFSLLFFPPSFFL